MARDRHAQRKTASGHTCGTPCEDGSRESGAMQVQGTPRVASFHKTLGEMEGTDFPSEVNTADNPERDLYPLGQRK